MKRTWISIALLASLSACGDPEINGCEKYVKEGLRSPSTYKRVEVSIHGEPIKITDLKAYGKQVGETNARQENQLGLGLRTVFITFDADNAYGTPVRGIEACQFKVVGGDSQSEDEIERNVNMAISDRASGQMNTQDDKIRASTGQVPLMHCCLGAGGYREFTNNTDHELAKMN